MNKIVIVALSLLINLQAMAANLPDFPFIVSVGFAEKEVKPDLATIYMNIESFDVNSKKALIKANEAMDKVLKVMKKHHLKISSLKASDIEKDVKREKGKNYQQLAILGYEISRRLNLKINEIAIYPELMADLIEINNLNSFSTDFDTSKLESIKSSLLKKAGANARKKANSMAASLESRVDSVYAISQSSNFNGFFETFGGNSYSVSRDLMFKSRERSKVLMFAPEFIKLRQSINVVFRLKNN